MKTLCCVMSYEITRGMKSRGPIGLLKKNNISDELIIKQIESLDRIFYDQDTYVVAGFGADKLQKRIPANVSIILNDKFSSFNQVYAFKLFLETIQHIDDYSGIFLLSSDVIIKKLSNTNLDKSWVITKQKNNRQKEEGLLSVGLDKDQKLNTIFYNIGNMLWCNAVYLCRKDVEIISDTIDQYYDNMFLFELINKSVDRNKLTIGHNPLVNNNDCVFIRGPKDKYKII